MNNTLPEYIDPFRLADTGAELKGYLNIKKMERLQELTSSSEGKINVHLVFGKDLEKKRVINLYIKADISLVCQRCMRPVQYSLDTQSLLSPVISESQATNLPKDYDPLITHGEPVLLAEIVEEDILLNIPMIPKHSETCSPELPQFVELR